MLSTIVSTDTLASRLDDPMWVIVDCRFDLAEPAKGQRLYAESHLPGARYLGLEPDLSGAKSLGQGRHPLPPVADFVRVLAELGIGSGVQVVAYDDRTGLWASRLWWMLRSIGHDAVAVLDGGLGKWIAEGRPTTAVVPDRPALRGDFSGYRGQWSDVSTLANVAAIVEQSGRTRLVDARAPERYRGESETIDRVAGHIPGATNYFFQRSLNADGTFRSAGELRAQWMDALAGRAPSETICYCGSGVTACHTLLSLELAGLGGAKLYPGSWSEWSSDSSRPVATGPES